jgi:hypothetical protein
VVYHYELAKHLDLANSKGYCLCCGRSIEALPGLWESEQAKQHCTFFMKAILNRKRTAEWDSRRSMEAWQWQVWWWSPPGLPAHAGTPTNPNEIL